MTVTDEDLESQIGAYAERLFEAGHGALQAATIVLGRRLGLYAALAELGVATPPDLAAKAGIHGRYAREWLEQQASAGWIDLVAGDGSSEPDERRYSLPAAATHCLVDPESLASVGPLLDLLPSVGEVLPALLDAYRTGGGVPYADYGIHDAQGDFNRPAFRHLLTTEWLPAVPGLTERLAADPPARMAEIGSGEGWAAINVALTWPSVRVDGFDLDEASIAAARRNAAEAGVADRVHFEVVDVTSGAVPGAGEGAYDFVLAFEMIHDLARPVAALTTMRSLAGPGAAVIVADENVADTFEAPSPNPIEQLMYAASVLHCLPVGMAGGDGDSAGTGTVMRPDTLRGYAHAAGFTAVEILPIEHDFFRFYRLIT
jgi:2-polyprenyl-3-methyl-5-hydroxy-6-metoxy-1,4-benzoquinol methylase